MAAHAAKNPPELSNSEQFWQKVSRFQSKLSVKLHQNLIWWQKYYTFFKIKTLQISSFLRKSIIKSQKSLKNFFSIISFLDELAKIEIFKVMFHSISWLPILPPGRTHGIARVMASGYPPRDCTRRCPGGRRGMKKIEGHIQWKFLFFLIRSKMIFLKNRFL